MVLCPKAERGYSAGHHSKPEADGKRILGLSNSRFSKTSLERFLCTTTVKQFENALMPLGDARNKKEN
jgi:hypothetical protein